MGLFDFFRKKSKCGVSSPSISREIYNTPPPIPISVNKPSHKKIKDFFNIDIANLRPQEGECSVLLGKPELGIFNRIDYHFISDGSINIDIVSHCNQFSPELIEFINSCAKTFGPTTLGETVVTEKEKMLLQQGLFSRLWSRIWIDVSKDSKTGLNEIRITIFNLKKTAQIEMTL